MGASFLFGIFGRPIINILRSLTNSTANILIAINQLFQTIVLTLINTVRDLYLTYPYLTGSITWSLLLLGTSPFWKKYIRFDLTKFTRYFLITLAILLLVKNRNKIELFFIRSYYLSLSFFKGLPKKSIYTKLTVATVLPTIIFLIIMTSYKYIYLNNFYKGSDSIMLSEIKGFEEF